MGCCQKEGGLVKLVTAPKERVHWVFTSFPFMQWAKAERHGQCVFKMHITNYIEMQYEKLTSPVKFQKIWTVNTSYFIFLFCKNKRERKREERERERVHNIFISIFFKVLLLTVAFLKKRASCTLWVGDIQHKWIWCIYISSVSPAWFFLFWCPDGQLVSKRECLLPLGPGHEVIPSPFYELDEKDRKCLS